MWYDGVGGAFLIAIGALCVVSPRWVLLVDLRVRSWSPWEPRLAAVFTKKIYLWAVRISGLGVILLGLLWLFVACRTRR